MRHGSRPIPCRVPLLLGTLGLLVTLGPGCGEVPPSGDAPAGVDPALKKSNDQMENFMKSQMEAKKKR
ncbi:hypothetical protein [Paludisphaera soli]|uniref:hypothetical protein n=1 Tax=Paludisphaera soli TaxID=2712865 RepID=UPI0013EA50E4|nr:hypothetical protein [Paludisphaera soli]